MTNRGMSSWKGTGVIFKKEIKDGFRDWRSILFVLIYPIMGPLLIILLFTMIADISKEPDAVTLPVEGASSAPELISWLEQNGITPTKAPKNPKEKVRASSMDMALKIPSDYGKKMSAGEPVKVELIVDSTRHKNKPFTDKVSRVIKEYAMQMGALRLIARGINPKIAMPIAVKTVDVANKKAKVAKVLGMIPMWIMLAAFICGMMLAIDATAGERERGSLESLLLCPVKRHAIVIGKWLAASLFSGFGLVLTLLGMMGAVNYLPIEELGFSFSVDSQIIIGIIAATLPLALMATATMLLLATFARSFKEANTIVQFLMFLPMMPFFIDSFGSFSGSSEPWMFAIPIWAQHRLVSDVLAGDAPSLAMFAISGIISLAIGVLTIWGASRLFQKERIIFGR